MSEQNEVARAGATPPARAKRKRVQVKQADSGENYINSTLTRAEGAQCTGSQDRNFAGQLIGQAMRCNFIPAPASSANQEAAFEATLSALSGIAPRDELEGMLAAQMVACHNAAMECYRRAMLPDQPLQARQMNLSQANKLSRTYASLLEALNRHRGKGQQKVTVEHVHVHQGGQAIVGSVEKSPEQHAASGDEPDRSGR